MSTATARDSRNTRVESSRPITRIRIGSVTGMTERTTSAKISVGIAITRSTPRDRTWSTQPPTTAAVSPRIEPMTKLSTVAAVATAIVVRPP